MNLGHVARRPAEPQESEPANGLSRRGFLQAARSGGAWSICGAPLTPRARFWMCWPNPGATSTRR